MRILQYLVLFLLFTVSCTEKKEEVIDLRDISAQAKKDYDQPKDQEKDSTRFIDALPENYKAIIDSLQFPQQEIFAFEEAILPDRFSPKSTVKWYKKSAKDSLNFFIWEYTDSLKTKTAFFNWMDCYGSKCKSYTIGSNATFQKRTFLLLMGEKQLIFIDSDQKIIPTHWIGLLSKKLNTTNWKFVLFQKRNGKAEWTQIRDEKETKLEIKNGYL